MFHFCFHLAWLDAVGIATLTSFSSTDLPLVLNLQGNVRPVKTLLTVRNVLNKLQRLRSLAVGLGSDPWCLTQDYIVKDPSHKQGIQTLSRGPTQAPAMLTTCR